MSWKFLHQSEYEPGLYRGGFLIFDSFAAVVIWVIVSGRSKLGWLLQRPILRGIGQRSYSIYLWHWPVVVVTRPGIDVSGPSWVIQLARLGLILLLAEASYRLVERPVRTGRWEVPRPRLRVGRIEELRPVLGVLTGLTRLAVLLAAAPSSSAHASNGASGSSLIPSVGAPSSAGPSTHPTLP